METKFLEFDIDGIIYKIEVTPSRKENPEYSSSQIRWKLVFSENEKITIDYPPLHFSEEIIEVDSFSSRVLVDKI